MIDGDYRRQSTEAQRAPAGSIEPGGGEFSWGPGLAPPGVAPYRGRDAADTLSAVPTGTRTSQPPHTDSRRGATRRPAGRSGRYPLGDRSPVPTPSSLGNNEGRLACSTCHSSPRAGTPVRLVQLTCPGQWRRVRQSDPASVSSHPGGVAPFLTKGEEGLHDKRSSHSDLRHRI